MNSREEINRRKSNPSNTSSQRSPQVANSSAPQFQGNDYRGSNFDASPSQQQISLRHPTQSQSQSQSFNPSNNFDLSFTTSFSSTSSPNNVYSNHTNQSQNLSLSSQPPSESSHSYHQFQFQFQFQPQPDQLCSNSNSNNVQSSSPFNSHLLPRSRSQPLTQYRHSSSQPFSNANQFSHSPSASSSNSLQLEHLPPSNNFIFSREYGVNTFRSMKVGKLVD